MGAVFYIAPAFIPGEADVGKNVVEAAVDTGVRRFVFSAVIHPVLSNLVNHVAKVPVEEAVLTSGMEYTFLHPARYFQNYAAFWLKVVKEGVLAEPWSSETRFSLVDYRDVAEVTAIALTEERLLFGTFELCAPGHLNRLDVAALMSDVLGRKIRERRDPDILGDIPQGLWAMFNHYDRQACSATR
ncbi:NmrA family NAD(P)-binding protein [Mesorhizobium tamadayense]|uniref:NmrA family NAD(P)-binding protein n=1 Tax=Mesorhizobium tamadayense TaxID=425306 RepID=UPI0024792091|nr:NmrA family NAD(P)-binding protein [Mesorhizobium tamadayense]